VRLFSSNHTATTSIYTLSLHDALPIYEKVEFCKSRSDIINTGINNAGIFTDDIQASHAAVMNRLNHLVVVFAGLGRYGAIPRLFITGPERIVRYIFIDGEKVRHAVKVTAALYVIMTAQWKSSCSAPHIISGDKQQIGNRCARIASELMLCNPHRPANGQFIDTGNFFGNSL